MESQYRDYFAEVYGRYREACDTLGWDSDTAAYLRIAVKYASRRYVGYLTSAYAGPMMDDSAALLEVMRIMAGEDGSMGVPEDYR